MYSCVCMWVCACHSTHMEVRRQPWVLVVAFLHVLFTAAYARPPGLWASWGSSGSHLPSCTKSSGIPDTHCCVHFTWFLGSALKSALYLLSRLSSSNTNLTFLHLSTISMHKKIVETYHKISRSTTITQVLPPKGNLCPDSWDHMSAYACVWIPYKCNLKFVFFSGSSHRAVFVDDTHSYCLWLSFHFHAVVYSLTTT